MTTGILVVALWAMVIAQWIKIPIYYFKTGHWDWQIMLSTGSMPSSHSAFVVCVTTAIGIVSGVHSSVFALAVVFAMITVHDAIKVRGESGKQAKVINELVHELSLMSKLLNIRETKKRDKKLKELIGHNANEVFAGVFLGVYIAFIYYLIH